MHNKYESSSERRLRRDGWEAVAGVVTTGVGVAIIEACEQIPAEYIGYAVAALGVVTLLHAGWSAIEDGWFASNSDATKASRDLKAQQERRRLKKTHDEIWSRKNRNRK